MPGFLFISCCKHRALAAACFPEPRKTIFPFIYNLVKCQAAEVLMIISSRGNLFIRCKGEFHSRVGFFTLPSQEMLAAHVISLPVCSGYPEKLSTTVPAWLNGFPTPLPRMTLGPSKLRKEKQGKYSEVRAFMCLVRCNGINEFPIFLLLLCISYICFPDQPL